MKEEFSDNAVDIISKLLLLDPKKRLGSGKNGSEDIKSHPFFDGIDWESLYRKEVEAPFIPNIEDKDDISNIDPIFTNEIARSSTLVQPIAEEDQPKYYYEGFTFRQSQELQSMSEADGNTDNSK